jgi:tetratricopeptide (TPR) repeat protein
MAETSLNELSRDLRQLYSRGVEAAQRDNLDYATALFGQVVEKAPGCYECRAALRAAQQKKSGGGGGLFKRLLSGAGSSPLIAKGRMALSGNPLEAMQIAEQVLTGDPHNSLAHRLLADAALALEMPRTAVLSLEVLFKHSPQDKTLTVQLAQALAQAGDVARAETIMVDLCRAHPGIPDLTKELKNISALKTLGEGGYEQLAEGRGSYRDILRDKGEAVSLEQEQRAQKTEDVAARLIGEYEARLQSEPDNLRLVRSLAELYTQKNQFDRALGYYERLKASEMGNDPTLDRAMAQTIARKFDHAMAELNPFAPDHADRLAGISAEKLQYQITECQARVERYPADLSIRFEMGVLYFQADKISEAIAEFQKSQGNPHKRIASMGYLAQCFAKRKMFDMAARRLQDAIKEKPVLDEEKKDLIYNLGCVFESMGRKDEAIEQFKLIYETDIGYRDVAAKVDAYYAGR